MLDRPHSRPWWVLGLLIPVLAAVLAAAEHGPALLGSVVAALHP